MIKSEIIDRFALPDGTGEMTLSRRGTELAIRVRGVELMNTRNHVSEDELGFYAARLVEGKQTARVMIGGLGLGFTLRAVLKATAPGVHVDVVEIFGKVIEWNRAHTGAPVTHERVTVVENDVAVVIRESIGLYDAIVLDVDNGPDPVFDANAALYQKKGLADARRALAPGGGLAVWSAFESPQFTRWLHEVGFTAECHTVRAYGAKHFIWLAR
ncbi:MAG TPA: hypothetical protein VGC41_17070 [Kofleriaceae bacterium]